MACLRAVATLAAPAARSSDRPPTAAATGEQPPARHAPTAWQDPTHVRAMNENSWIYYCDWFWYLGWVEHRFAVQASGYLDLELREAPRERAAFMRVTLEKVVTTARERMVARTKSASLEVPDDPLDPSWPYRARPATALPAIAAS